MSINALIDVAIGLVVMYLVLSIFCTVINEITATVLKLRATSLRDGVEKLLDDPAVRAAFYDHGLMSGTKAVSNAGSKDEKNHPSYISGRVFAMALLGSLDPTRPSPSFAQVEEIIKGLPASNIRDVLLAQAAAADKELGTLRNNVAGWFDDSMDRLGGVYKRQLKVISFLVGLFLAGALNADSFAVGRALWHDGALRERVVKAADQTIKAGTPLNAPDGGKTLENLAKEQKAAEELLRPLPIGWPNTEVIGQSITWTVILKVFGILATTIAVMLGAPFWFDLLSKFMSVRGTGDKPQSQSQPHS